MRAVILDVDERLIAERHRLGLDHRDEMWEGVLHVVPPPSRRHQVIAGHLHAALLPVALRLGLEISPETGVFANGDDYKVPDIAVYDPSVASERGVDGAPALVVEIRSPGDESTEKLPWYFERGVDEVLVVDRDALELDLWRRGDAVRGEADGSLYLETLGITVTPGAGTIVVEGRALDL